MSDAIARPSTTVLDAERNLDSVTEAEDCSKGITSHAAGGQISSQQDDLNPRSPKRRRMSPVQDGTEVDFEAAAARALAISLGVDEASASPAPVLPQTQHNGGTKSTPVRAPENGSAPDQQSRIANLHNLDQLATQILCTLARMSHLEIGAMLFGPPSQRGQDYRALKAKFEQAKMMYLTNSPFICLPALELKDTDQLDTLRKTNVATFMASIFSGEIGLRIMDMNFLDVFVPEGGRLLKAQASIYLELKTQAFIAAKRTAPAMLNQVMLDLFPGDMEQHLVKKRPGAKSLAPSEVDFLKRLASRRDILYADMRNNRLENLELRYRWDDFSREVNGYLSKNYDSSGSGSKEKSDQTLPSPLRTPLQQEQMESQFSVSSDQPQQSNMDLPVTSTESDANFNMDDFMAQAARAAELALQGGGHTGYAPAQSNHQVLSQSPLASPAPPPLTKTPEVLSAAPNRVLTQTPPPASQSKPDVTPTVQAEFQEYRPTTADLATATATITQGPEAENSSGVPHKSQTAPTQVLYERARLVTTNKASPSSRKPNAPSHRRPWTNEEENALMTGLDQVKGPHWSQILAMYGPGGTTNESLKDRNQVQLKDKARNLKLFFLKAGIEVPYYLQAVTGDLKTRAPGQAEKREAKERERVQVEEDESVLHQEELQLGLADDLEVQEQPISDQEDGKELVPITYQAANEPSNNVDDASKDGDEDSFDMEAIIARAAAQATQSLEDPWA